jgi:hypothetical protein
MSKLILIVDDELAGLRKIHVSGVVGDFYDTLADVNDPIFGNLWSIAQTIPTLTQRVAIEQDASDFFQTDEAIPNLLLTAEFIAGASQDLKNKLAPFLARAERVGILKKLFFDAFPQPDFEVEFVGSPRPTLNKVTSCSAVFLDMVLEDGSVAPVESLQNYLKDLAQEAGEILLPPIVLMSLHVGLDENRLGFSEHARISAAGLMVLPKEKIYEPHFGSVGLRLSVDQLSRQSEVAHSMRLFIASWTSALAKATTETSKTMWNLDAAAMQQIHFASISDDDPYDEHLNELLSREHLFRVESDEGVGRRIRDLDAGFRKHLTPDEKGISNRLIAPFSDVETARAFMSRFTWLGSLPTIQHLGFSAEESASRISRSLPFGSVLSGRALTNGSQCLVHITQQCDLNGISRSKNGEQTLMFAVTEACELHLSDNPSGSNSPLAARSLRISEGGELREFDLKVDVKAMLSMPLREFLSLSRQRGYKVVGRLRSDITNHIVAAISNQMSRPASQKMLRPALLRAKVFLQSTHFKGGKIALTETDQKARVFTLTLEDEQYCFPDDSCIDIALWLATELVKLGKPIDVDPLCTSLRRGWKNDSLLVDALKVKVRNCTSLNSAFNAVVRGDVNNDVVQLTVVCER